MNSRRIILLLIVVLALAFGSASRTASQKSGRNLTVADLKKLRWIEGTWRGTGDVAKPFFERYRFENETTLAVDGFEDGTLAKVTDTTRFTLTGGQFSGGSEGSSYVAVSLDDRSIEFGPAVNVRNSFRWERESDDVWKATIMLPANGDKPARQRVYKMDRWPQPAKT